MSAMIFSGVLWATSALIVLVAVALIAAVVLGPLTKSRGTTRTFYGEDRRHAIKEHKAYNGVRLVLKEPVNVAAVKDRVLAMLKGEGPHSLLRAIFQSTTKYHFTDLSDKGVVEMLVHQCESGVQKPSQHTAVSADMWRKGLPLRIYVHGNTLDLMAHHAVFDGVRGIRLLNELFGNGTRKGAIRPQDLPCCLVACSMSSMTRVLRHERPCGTLGAKSAASQVGHHESQYLRVPAALVKGVKTTHGVGFAPSLQGFILWMLFRSGLDASTLHVASTVGFKSDWFARLGSAFNHYGAFPMSIKDESTPQELSRAVAKKQRRNGMMSGFPCLLANASCGGMAGSMADLYKSIDVLIGGGPLVLDPACGYDSYQIFKFTHTVPIYILYVTICDHIDISFHSRVPLPRLQTAFAEGIKHLSAAPIGPTPATAASG